MDDDDRELSFGADDPDLAREVYARHLAAVEEIRRERANVGVPFVVPPDVWAQLDAEPDETADIWQGPRRPTFLSLLGLVTLILIAVKAAGWAWGLL